MLILIALSACIATLFGGLFALQLKDRLHLILGFSAGAVIGVAFFDLLPESLSLASAAFPFHTIVSIAAGGFLCYLVLDRSILMHSHNEEDVHEHNHQLSRGYAGASTLAFHSMLDGIGIGLGFQVSPAIGIAVAAAVLAHDFSDGINTVNMIVRNGGNRARAFRWLLLDAVAPLVGIALTMFITVSETTLGLLLAFFAGLFLYIGASDLVPESYHEHPVRFTTIATILGALCIFAITKIAG